jgi:hypothetical protein
MVRAEYRGFPSRLEYRTCVISGSIGIDLDPDSLSGEWTLA